MGAVSRVDWVFRMFDEFVRLAVWNGEWGPVYDSQSDEVNAVRLHVLKDQLALYDVSVKAGLLRLVVTASQEAQIGWSIWL